MHRLGLLSPVAALALTGCIHQSGGIAASTLPLAPDGYRVLGPAKGKDCVYYLFGVIPVSGGNETHTAVTNALRSVPGSDVLVNVTADTYTQWLVILTRTCTQVFGTAATTL